MKIIHTDEPLTGTSEAEKLWCYNGYDAMLTAEIRDVLLPQLDEYTGPTYDFSRALQGPALEMRLRGVRIDPRRKAEVIDEFYDKIEILEAQLERIVNEGCGFWNFNWRSTPDLKKLFYDILGIPPVRFQGRVTVNRGALEKMEAYLIAKQIVRHIAAMRDLAKKISVLKTEIDPDGRIRTSYNIAGTSTGRFSSSFSEFGTGGNLQNVEESLRSMFIADPGMKMAYFDGEQLQSRVVGAVEWNLFGDGRYLDACESGDLHTVVAKLIWPKLPWTGILKEDKAIAETPFYRHYTHRFMCKKIGHGTNFDGKPEEISRQTKIERTLIEDFQPKYFKAFPAHTRWKIWTEEQLRRFGYIIALTGRKRYFFGRRNDPATVREGLAYQAQADEAFIVNTGMLNIFRARDATLYMHDHDALTVQYPEEQEDEIIPLIKEQLCVPIPLNNGRELVIPFGCKTGWNKGEYCCGDRSRPACKDCTKEANPDGLKSYTPGDKRTRTKETSILDRSVR